MPDRAAALVRAYWSAMNSNDFASAARYLAPDVTIDWPQSNERICGRADFVALNSAYPAQGAWRFDVLRLEVSQSLRDVITVTDITDGQQRARAITFSLLTPEADLIQHQTEYWPDPYAPPKDRSAWTCPIPEDTPEKMPALP